jgi:hypothetical protein
VNSREGRKGFLKMSVIFMFTAVIQTIAAVVQAAAAILFFKTVQQKRRDDIIRSLHGLWGHTANGPTPEELSGCPFSQRQVDFFNSKLRERGERWSFPFKRIT